MPRLLLAHPKAVGRNSSLNFPGALPFRLLKIPIRSAGIHHITANRFNDAK
jgi:hypothetical protein